MKNFKNELYFFIFEQYIKDTFFLVPAIQAYGSEEV